MIGDAVLKKTANLLELCEVLFFNPQFKSTRLILVLYLSIRCFFSHSFKCTSLEFYVISKGTETLIAPKEHTFFFLSLFFFFCHNTDPCVKYSASVSNPFFFSSTLIDTKNMLIGIWLSGTCYKINQNPEGLLGRAR